MIKISKLMLDRIFYEVHWNAPHADRSTVDRIVLNLPDDLKRYLTSKLIALVVLEVLRK